MSARVAAFGAAVLLFCAFDATFQTFALQDHWSWLKSFSVDLACVVVILVIVCLIIYSMGDL